MWRIQDIYNANFHGFCFHGEEMEDKLKYFKEIKNKKEELIKSKKKLLLKLGLIINTVSILVFSLLTLILNLKTNDFLMSIFYSFTILVVFNLFLCALINEAEIDGIYFFSLDQIITISLLIHFLSDRDKFILNSKKDITLTEVLLFYEEYFSNYNKDFKIIIELSYDYYKTTYSKIENKDKILENTMFKILSKLENSQKELHLSK